MKKSMQRQPEPELMDLAAEAKAYAAADFSAVNIAFVGRLLELTAGVEGVRAVDLGTGPAEIPIRLVQARPSWRVTAVDASEAMLELAAGAITQAGLDDAIELVLADAKATGLAGGRFDVVFSSSILHHISDAAAFWAEIKRLAAPGAFLFLRDLARPADARAARNIVHKYAGDESELLQEEFFRSLLSAYSVDEIRSQLASASLDGLEVAMVTDRHLDVWGSVI